VKKSNLKIPKTLKIGGFIWKVLENQDVSNESGMFGSTHFKQQKFFIEPIASVTQQKREQCLLHEILHAVWWQTGLFERYKDTPKIEEEIIHTLSNGIYQVLKDNKLLK